MSRTFALISGLVLAATLFAACGASGGGADGGRTDAAPAVGGAGGGGLGGTAGGNDGGNAGGGADAAAGADAAVQGPDAAGGMAGHGDADGAAGAAGSGLDAAAGVAGSGLDADAGNTLDARTDAPSDVSDASSAKPSFVLSGRYAHAVAQVGDVDGDGKLDLILAGASTQVWRGRGDGTFLATPATTAIQSGSIVPGPASQAMVGSFDGDARADLVMLDTNTTNGDVRVFFARGQADATFAGQLSFPLGQASAVPYVLTDIADFTGDGVADVVVAALGRHVNNQLTLLTYQWTTNLGGSISIQESALSIGPVGATNPNVQGFLAASGGDVDGDGKRDVGVEFSIPGNYPTVNFSSFWARGKGNGLFSDGPAISAPVAVTATSTSTSPWASLADADGDGKVDFLARAGNVDVYWNQGGTAGSVDFLKGPEFDTSSSIGVADFDGDAKPDLYLPDSTGVTILKGDGARGFGTTLARVQGTLFRDFNGDGATDIALVTSGRTSIYLSTAKGAYVAAPDIQCVVAGCTKEPTSF